MIVAVGVRLPAGLAGQVRPHRRSRGGSPPAPRSRTPEAEINYLIKLAAIFIKKALKNRGKIQ
ncbi:hypothetical protein BSG1_20530 [Bacillus sp. SG-1]|nr:hypothetical protein BSG1_20530 [Bacillus sp. SG-1]